MRLRPAALSQDNPQTYPQVFVDITRSVRRNIFFAPQRALVAPRKLAAARCFGLQSPAHRAQKKGNALFAIVQAAGWPIWFLLLASIIAVALIIERSMSLRARRVTPPELFDQVVAVFQRQGVNDDVLQKLAK